MNQEALMEKFYSDYNQVKVRQIKALLDNANIPCFIKNEFIQGASGEIPPHETLPELWLMDGEWRVKAQQIVDELESEIANASDIDWTCENCAESNEGQFMICWQCQSSRVF